MNKIVAALGAAGLALALLTGCDAPVKGTVLNVYGPEATTATMGDKCGKGSWSLSIDTNGTDAGIKNVCLSQGNKDKYKVGDPYP